MVVTHARMAWQKVQVPDQRLPFVRLKIPRIVAGGKF
jgi:hypothetical protein